MSCGSQAGSSYYDIYSLDFGVRSIEWSGNYKPTWKINSKNFYCRGANRHEDYPVR
jgi:beta-galactosidase/beta-glucuronidase